MTNRLLRLALLAGSVASFARLTLGVLVGLSAFGWSEADMLLLLDFPTMGVYELADRLGYGWRICSVWDLRFFSISALVWFALGFALTVAVGTARSRLARA